MTRFFLLISSITLISLSCKKEQEPDDPIPGENPLLTYSSLVNDNADWTTIVTTSSEDSQNPLKFNGIFAGKFNSEFIIQISGKEAISNQYWSEYRLSFPSESSNSYTYLNKYNTGILEPYFYKNPTNTNEFYTIGGGKYDSHTNGNNGGENVLFEPSWHPNFGKASVKKTIVNPFSESFIKIPTTYTSSFISYPLSMNNSDFTSDFALCGTSEYERGFLLVSPAGLNNDTYLYLPPASDFSPDTYSGSAYHSSQGFFNHDNNARFLGIHFRRDDTSLPQEVGYVKAKCYYPSNINASGFFANSLSGANPIKSLILEKEFTISTNFLSELPSGLGTDAKTLITDNAIYYLVDFFESDKIYYFKYDFVQQEFTELLDLQAYPPDFKLKNCVISPDGNLYFFNSNNVFVAKNGTITSIHDRSMFVDPTDVNTSYKGIAMKGDKLLLFVVKDLWFNSNDQFDYKVSTIIANTTF